MKYKVLDVRQTWENKSWFVLEGNEHWEVVAKWTSSGLTRTRFDVYQDGKLQYTLMQTSRLKQLLKRVPIIDLFYQNPFFFSGMAYAAELGSTFGIKCPMNGILSLTV